MPRYGQNETGPPCAEEEQGPLVDSVLEAI